MSSRSLKKTNTWVGSAPHRRNKMFANIEKCKHTASTHTSNGNCSERNPFMWGPLGCVRGKHRKRNDLWTRGRGPAIASSITQLKFRWKTFTFCSCLRNDCTPLSSDSCVCAADKQISYPLCGSLCYRRSNLYCSGRFASTFRIYFRDLLCALWLRDRICVNGMNSRRRSRWKYRSTGCVRDG